MSSDAARERRLFFLLLLGTALLAFWHLGSLPLVDVDEPVYGQVGKEMAAQGVRHWLTPTYQGQPWFDKPPLFYWLTACAMRLFGVSEWTARMPSALLAVALVAVTYALARRAYPQVPRTGLWAGFILATGVQFFLLARAAVTDMTLALTLTLALLGLWQWLGTGRGRWIALAGAMTGLAALTKGPVALVLIGVQTIGCLCLTRQAKRLLAPAIWGGFALCLLVALPWYLAMIHLHGPAFIGGFLEANNVSRYLQPEHRATQSPLFFVPVLLAGFFPWSLALPSAFVQAWKEGRAENHAPLFLGLWCILVFCFFSASQSKLITYIFPLYPAAAILTGRWLALRSETFRHFVPLWIYAALSLLLGIALGIVGHKYAVAPVTLWTWTLALALGAAISLAPLRAEIRWLAPGVATAIVLLATWCSPTWKTQETAISERRLAWAAKTATAPGSTIYALTLNHPSLVFYSDRRVYSTDSRPEILRAMQVPSAVLATRPQYLTELQTKYGLRNFRVLCAYPRTVLVQATPHEAPAGK